MGSDDQAKKLGQFFYMHDRQHAPLAEEARVSGDSMGAIIREGIDLVLEKRRRERDRAR